MLLKHFSPFLPRKSTELAKVDGLHSRAIWANMSARVGSISDNQLGGWYSYRASKAAVNQITKTFDNYLRTSAGDKALAISLHPGTVISGLSAPFRSAESKPAPFTPEESASHLLDVLNRLSPRDSGRVFAWDNQRIPF